MTQHAGYTTQPTAQRFDVYLLLGPRRTEAVSPGPTPHCRLGSCSSCAAVGRTATRCKAACTADCSAGSTAASKAACAAERTAQNAVLRSVGKAAMQCAAQLSIAPRFSSEPFPLKAERKPLFAAGCTAGGAFRLVHRGAAARVRIQFEN